MTTAYNIANRMAQSTNADRRSRSVPSGGGTIIVSPVDRATALIDNSGVWSLEDAAGLGLGTTISVFSSSAGVNVEGDSLPAGSFAEYMVIVDSSGAKAWTNRNLAV